MSNWVPNRRCGRCGQLVVEEPLVVAARDALVALDRGAREGTVDDRGYFVKLARNKLAQVEREVAVARRHADALDSTPPAPSLTASSDEKSPPSPALAPAPAPPSSLPATPRRQTRGQPWSTPLPDAEWAQLKARVASLVDEDEANAARPNRIPRLPRAPGHSPSCTCAVCFAPLE